MRKILLFAVALLMAFTAQAEEKKEKKERKAELYGQAFDSFTRVGVKAFVMLMREDSTVVDTVTCTTYDKGRNSYYQFAVPFKEGKYILKATAEGYEDLLVDYTLKSRRHNQQFPLPELLMKRKAWKSVNLDGVVVKGTRVQIAYRGDTIVYDASAFNLPEGSMLDALIRQLPGAELKDNGDIYVNGKKVDYLTLNGSDFFKGENKVMLDNLPYYTVKDIKVYNKMTEKSEMIGRDVEQRDYVMDVSLKREYARGYIANAEAGIGTENRWTGRLFGLYYDDRTRVSVFGNANNVNETREPGSDGEWSPSKVSRSLVTTRQAGLHLETSDKEKKVKERLDVKVGWDDNDSESRNLRETFATSGNIFRRSQSVSTSDNFNMSLTNQLRINKWGSSYLSMRYSKSDNAWQSADSTYSDVLTNRSTGIGFGKRETFSLNGYVSLSKSWETGDWLSFSFQPYVNISKPDVQHSIDRTYYAQTDKHELRNNYSDSYNKSYSGYFGLSYNYQLPDFWNIDMGLSYQYQNQDNKNDRFRLDSLGSDSPYDQLGVLPSSRDSLLMAMDSQNSYEMQMTKQRYRAQIGFYRSNDDMYFSVSLPISYYKEKMDYARAVLDTTARRSYSMFAPSILFRTYGKKKLEFHYYMNTEKPEFSTLMPIYDNSNPLAMRINNPDVKDRTEHDLAVRLNIKCDSIDLSYWVRLVANIRHNAWGTRTNYNTRTGAYTYMTDNIGKANWFGELSAGANGSFDKKKRLRYSIDGRAKYERSVDFDVAYDDEPVALSKVNTVITSGTAKLTYKLGKLTVGAIGKLTSRHSSGNRENFQRLNVYDYQYGMNVQYTVPVLNVNVATDLNNFSRRGYGTSDMNTDELIWNAQLSRSFLKGKLIAKLTAYDLLKKLSTTSYNVNAQGRTETWYRSVPRYVMFTLAYRFNKQPEKK